MTVRRVTGWLVGLVIAATACRPGGGGLPHLTSEPTIRIGLLTNASHVRVGADGPVAAVRDGRPLFRLRPGETIALTPSGRSLAAAGADPGRYERLTFTALAHGAHVTVDGRPYRGVVEVFVGREGHGVTVVDAVGLEDYLQGVVNAEMGARGPKEKAALEAQAIASRTYALTNRGKFASAGYDLDASVRDQAYGGVAAETAEGIAAVRATAGRVLVYHGRLIDVFFHSTCGFSTAAPQEVFRSVPSEPYLRPVSDKRPGGGYYCDISPHFRWTVEWDASQLRDILRRTLPAVIGIDASAVKGLRDAYVRRRGPSGRAVEVRFVVDGGEIPVFGPDLRAVLRTPDGAPLGSTAIELSVRRDHGRLAHLTATGVGWGHGVGLCQWGAVGRARAGQDARTILETYFPGATIARWY